MEEAAQNVSLRWEDFDWGPCAHCGALSRPKIRYATLDTTGAWCRTCTVVVFGRFPEDLFAAWRRRPPGMDVAAIESYLELRVAELAANGHHPPSGRTELSALLLMITASRRIG